MQKPLESESLKLLPIQIYLYTCYIKHALKEQIQDRQIIYSINHYFHISRIVFIATITDDDLSKSITDVSFFSQYASKFYSNFTPNSHNSDHTVCSTEMEM
jgi:hypothetical protein